MTPPRTRLQPDERDNVLMDMALDIQELKTHWVDFMNVHEKCQLATCSRIATIEEDAKEFKRDTVKGAVGFGVAIIGALVTGMVALFHF